MATGKIDPLIIIIIVGYAPFFLLFDVIHCRHRRLWLKRLFVRYFFMSFYVSFCFHCILKLDFTNRRISFTISHIVQMHTLCFFAMNRQKKKYNRCSLCENAWNSRKENFNETRKAKWNGEQHHSKWRERWNPLEFALYCIFLFSFFRIISTQSIFIL